MMTPNQMGSHQLGEQMLQSENNQDLHSLYPFILLSQGMPLWAYILHKS